MPGVVWPARMVTLLGEIVTLDVSLLASATVTLLNGACDKETASVGAWPKPTVALVGTTTAPGLSTVTLVVAFAIVEATAVAVIVVGPAVREETSTFTVVAFAVKMTLSGTVATAGLLEVRLTVSPPAGAGAERLSATFCVVTPVIVTVGEANVMTAVTFTAALADV